MSVFLWFAFEAGEVRLTDARVAVIVFFGLGISSGPV